MKQLALDLAFGDYDRIAPLRDGTVRPEGIELTVIPFERPEEIFWRMLMHQEFDVAEMSLGSVEADYYRRTGLFPIMHTVVLKQSLYERHSWVAQSLVKAFAAAKDRCAAAIYDTGALRYMLPWIVDEYEAARELMGDDFWPYGLEPNRHANEEVATWPTIGSARPRSSTPRRRQSSPSLPIQQSTPRSMAPAGSAQPSTASR